MLLEHLAICQSEISSPFVRRRIDALITRSKSCPMDLQLPPQLARAEGIAIGNASQLVVVGCFRSPLQARNRRGHNGDDLLNKAVLRAFLRPGNSLCGTTTDQELSPPRPDHQPTASRPPVDSHRHHSPVVPIGHLLETGGRGELGWSFRSNNSWRESIPAVPFGRVTESSRQTCLSIHFQLLTLRRLGA